MSSPLRTVVHTRRRPPDAREDTVAADAAGRDSVATDAAGGEGGTGDPSSPSPRRSSLAVASLALPVVAFGWFGWTAHPELRVGLPIVVVLSAVVAWLTRDANRGRSFDLAGILLAGFAAKLCFVAIRFNSIYAVYSGQGDAEAYHENGVRLAQAYRALDFSEPADQKIPGTGFIRIVTGYVYAIFTDSIAVGFIAFGLFAFIGTYLLFRAFETAVPEGNARRFALFIFLWPSMLFWPGSIGKEAWMLLGIGLFTFGAARVLSHQRGGFLLAAVGTWAVVMTRPHVILLLFGAFAVGYALRPGSRFSNMGFVTKAFGLAFIFVAGTFILTASNEFFGIEELNRESLEAELQETEEQTSQGGSSFQAPDPLGSPIGYPVALVTVLFRPFPFEADNLQMLFTSIEGLLLAGMMTVSLHRIMRAPALLRRWPFVAASAAYVAVFAFAFSSIGNFGILARQRVQMLPFVFVLISLPPIGVALANRRDRVNASPEAAPAHPPR